MKQKVTATVVKMEYGCQHVVTLVLDKAADIHVGNKVTLKKEV